MNAIFTPFDHISLLESATSMGDNLPTQEEINFNNNAKEPVEESISTGAKIEQSGTSESASAKRKRKSKPSKAMPKQPQVLQKKSTYKDYGKDDDLIKNNPNKKKRTSKCPHVGMHEKRDLAGLSEEQDVRNLDNGYLSGAHCSVCKKVIVNKTKLTEQESATETMFNKKRLLFTCNNYSAANDMHCSFFICHQCFVDVSKNDNNAGARRSRSRTK